MEKNTIIEDIKRIVSKTFEIDSNEIQEDSNFITDFGLDSLKMAEIMVGIEERYGIILDDYVFSEATTLEKAAEEVFRIVNERV